LNVLRLVAHMSPPPLGVRIGELSRRVGVAPETLRAWEQRYGLLHPSRTAGGYRVYNRADEARALRMRELIDSGWAAAQAAQAVRTVPAGREDTPTPVGVDDAAKELLGRLLAFDASAGQEAFDRLLGSRSLDVMLRDVVLPVLREVGERWARGEISVAQEHFATELITGRLHGLARDWDRGLGPRVVLACPAGERHDIGLLCCGLALDRRGWRVTYLGPDTPIDALDSAVRSIDPSLVVIGAVQPGPLRAAADALAGLAGRVTIAVGGAGASPALAAAAGAMLLEGDPVGAAGALTEAAR
jgi:MerR family transcriptional regulator, light-induced transcriptional regulator